MGKELDNRQLERTVISLAHELTDLERTVISQACEITELRDNNQAEKDRADLHGGVIRMIGKITYDNVASWEEKVRRIQLLVYQWEEQENYE